MRRAWWWIAAIGSVLAACLLWSLGRRRGPSPSQVVKDEIRAIEAAKTAAASQAKIGADRAKAAVEEAHKTELAALDGRQKAQADALADDPAALARYLVRVGRGTKPTA
ncbi:MAG TPA: hypothetical protein VLI71_07835 [Gammaproteobacteria bacterium]|nr:hypothetical protein [Gammaproteobacteria bacterium]